VLHLRHPSQGVWQQTVMLEPGGASASSWFSPPPAANRREWPPALRCIISGNIPFGKGLAHAKLAELAFDGGARSGLLDG
jgi:hypothetical protein